MTIRLNEQQAEAVRDFDHNLLVTAGAGTGKTRVLTSKYLALLEERRLEVSEIAAVTFTTKAADEMRLRIREGIKSHIRRSSGGERDFWVRQLEALEVSSQISTIHGLCFSFLTRYPIAAGIDPQVEVVDEAEAAILQAEAGERALRRLLSEDLSKEAVRVLLEQGTKFFTADLIEIYPAIRESGAGWAEIEERAREYLLSSPREAEKAKKELLCLVEEILEAARSLKLTARAERLLGELATDWPQAKEILESHEEIDEDLLDCLEWIASLLPKNLNKQLRPEIDRFHVATGAYRQSLAGARALSQLPVIMAYLKDFDREYQEIKRSAGKMDFGDQLLLTRKLLREHPEIAVEYQERFSYFLIDEVQDTNSLQWEILSLLMGADASGRNQRTGGRCFLVGDVKQSIYRFRGAEVEVIADLASEFTKGSGRRLNLETNYRTLTPLAEVINSLCQRLFSAEDYPYHPLTPTRKPADNQARSEILLIEGERKEEPLVVAARLKELVENEEIRITFAGGERPVSYGDIALLFRTATNLPAYEEAFRRYDLPFLVNVGRGFYLRQEVQDQINLLRLVEEADDAIALATVLRSPFCALSDHDLFWLAQPDGLVKGFYQEEDFPEQIPGKTRERLKRFREYLRVLQENAHLLSIPTLLRLVHEETGYLAVLSRLPDGARRLANIEKLYQRAQDYMDRGYCGVRELIALLEHLTDLSVREGEALLGGEGNQIQMMTVHAAKGLEFPVVVLPELGSRFPATPSGPVFFHKKLGFAHKIWPLAGRGEETPLTQKIKEVQKREEISELKRLFYVAMTRAEDYLLLAGAFSKKEVAAEIEKAGSWMEWLWQLLPELAAEGEEGVSEIMLNGWPITFSRRSFSSFSEVAATKSGGREAALWDSTREEEDLPFAWEARRADTTGRGGEYDASPLPTDDKAPPVTGRRVTSASYLGTTGGRVALSPLLTYISCPRKFYWRHRLGVNSEYLPEMLPPDAFSGEEEAATLEDEEQTPTVDLTTDPPAFHGTKASKGVLIGNAFHRLVAGYGYKGRRLGEEWAPELAMLSQEEQEEALLDLEVMWANYRKSRFFPESGVEVYNEYPFLLELGGVAIKGVIDRILRDAGGSLKVVDFKTNRRVPTGSLLEEYRMQIAVYSLAVQEIFKRPPKEAAVYFVYTDTILNCLPRAEELAAIRERIPKIVEFIRSHDDPEDYAPIGDCKACSFSGWCLGKEGQL